MESHQNKHFESNKMDTKLIHAGVDGINPMRALNPPLFLTSTFSFETAHDAEEAFKLQTNDFIYTRLGNPTVTLLEKRMAAIEGGADAAAFASGMAAISTVLLSLLKQNDCIISHKTLYGCTFGLLKHILPRYGISTKFIDLTTAGELEKAISDNCKCIYFETPANPNMAIIDIEAVVKIAKAKNLKVIVDNTFATPYLTNPLKMGVDIVVHSATKYICGHGDTVAGIAIANDADYIKQLKFANLKDFGGCISPFNAWLLLRGLKTLSVRMKQQCANAMQIAQFLEKNPRVKKVYYPGLKSSTGHDIAKKQMRDFGAMITFECHGSFEEAVKVVNSTKLIILAVSLGDCESLIQIPAAMTHSGYNQDELAEFGLSKTMIRLSIGLEDPDDLVTDLDQALSHINL